MSIIYWGSVGLSSLVVIVWFRRMLIQFQLERIQLPANPTVSFKQKLDYVKQVEQSKHVSALLFVVFFLAMSVLLLTVSLAQATTQVHQITKQTSQLKDELYLMKKEQKQLMTKMPIQPYPAEGIGLKAYSWDALFLEEKREEQYKLESDLSAKVSPYFGLSTTLIDRVRCSFTNAEHCAIGRFWQ